MINFDRLEKVAHVIEKNHKHFDMEEGLKDEDGDAYDELDNIPVIKGNKLIGKCGTTCCIAGFATIMFAKNPEDHIDSWAAVEYEAMNVLGAHKEEDKSLLHDLFNTSISGTIYLSRDREEFGSSEEYAKAGAKKIREFIAEHKPEEEKVAETNLFSLNDNTLRILKKGVKDAGFVSGQRVHVTSMPSMNSVFITAKPPSFGGDVQAISKPYTVDTKENIRIHSKTVGDINPSNMKVTDIQDNFIAITVK